jgi:ribosomal protein S15P/S13E
MAETKKIDKESVEKKIIELANQGIGSEKIGLTIKKEFGISGKASGIKISKILKENKIYEFSDLKNLKKRSEELKKHVEKNRQDKNAQKALIFIEAKIRGLEKYYSK